MPTSDAEPDPIDDLSFDEEGELLPEAAKNRTRRRLLLIIGGAVVLIGGGTGLGLWLTASSPAVGLVVTNQVVKATTGTIEQTVSTSGTLEPATQANLNFAVSGSVTAVDVKSGQTVTAGQVLATVDTSALQQQVNAADAQLAAANDRLSSDRSSGATTTTIDSDESSVTSAESSLSTAQTNLADASLTSTIAGTVASVSLTVGQQVSGSGTGSGGANAAAADSGSSTAQVVVISTGSYIVNTTVDDTQVGQIAAGDQATITPSGSTVVDGTVASIGLIASESSNVADFPVLIDVTGDPPGLYAGSTADVSIIVKQLNNVTEVPTAAITYNPTSGQATVTKVINGKHVVTNVTVGDAQSGETQITAGVKSGDKVVERVVTFKGVGGAGGTGIFGGGGTGGAGRLGGGTGGFTGGGGRFTGGGGGFTGAGG
ncbi:MAG TPA: biotin/lipoyl-binding protein [Acidimicrobiales bacterium]